MLRQIVQWVVQPLALLIVLRWVALRLRRVLLLPTADTTPPVGPESVTPGIRRLIVSDIHMGSGDRLDDFDSDEELAAFIRSHALGGGPTELILAGDTFEFLQVRLSELGDYEWSGAAARRRLQEILSAHPEPIAALRAFVAAPGMQLTVLIGNHDFELHYDAAKQLLRQALNLPPDDRRLRFAISYEGGGIYLEHGNQFDPWNRFMSFEGISEPFEVVRGTQVVKDVINPLEDDPLTDAPLVDNVKPVSAFFWYMLSLPRLRRPEVRRFVTRSLLLLFRSVALPRTYRRPVIQVREELLGAPGQTLQRELALQAVYDSDPNLRRAAAARYGGVEPELHLRQRIAQGSIALAQAFAHRLGGEREPSEAALAQMEQEAGRQLRREIREFKDSVLRQIAQIAASPEHGHNTLFVCGHTHLAQVVALSDTQTYINIGTWTEVVLDIAAHRRQEQRFPFLEICYPEGRAAPHGQLLVWRGIGQEPAPWSAGPDVAEEDDQ